MKNSLWITMMVMVPFIFGCSKKDFSIPASDASFQQIPTMNNKVDILFVSDDSASMTSFRQGMGAQALNMITALNKAGMDYHIAVTTSSLGAGYMGGKFVGATYVTNATANVASVLGQMLAFNFPGSDLEQGLLSLKTALSPANLNLVGGGFLRNDALLAVIIVSDDNDYSTGTPADYLTFLKALKPNSTNGAPNLVVNYVGSLEANAACGNYVNVGTRYMSLAGLTSGLQASVCDSNWAAILTNIQIQFGQLLTNYYLAVEPNPSSIVVTVNGVRVANSANNGWTLQSSTTNGVKVWFIKFNGTAIPTLYSTINVSFTPASAN